ncbi:hypothetical protein ACFL6K_06715 [Candidatus Latescibacterota bacterium]
MRKSVIAASLLILVFSGCSMFAKAPVEIVKGEKVVCIIYNETEFKTALVKNVTTSLEINGYRVITDRVKNAKFYKSADFGAVVYMAEYWAWHTPFHAKRFLKKNKSSENTLFVVTAGDLRREIHRPFDAITCASRSNLVDTKAYEIGMKLDRIFKIHEE